MKLQDYLRLGWDQLKRRKVVTALCAAGIAIGSASIIVALSFGESLTYYTEQQMNRWFKMDEITVTTGYSLSADGGDYESIPITATLLETIRTLPGVQAASPYQDVGYMQFVVDATKHGNFQLIATEPEHLTAFGHTFRQGAPSDVKNTIILNYAATLDLYDEREAVYQVNRQADRDDTPVSYPLYQKTIWLKKHISESDGSTKEVTYPLRVVGVLSKPEGVPANMLRNPKVAYISLETAESLYQFFKAAGDTGSDISLDTYSEARVKVADIADIPRLENTIKKLKLNVQSNLYQQERMKQELTIIRMIFGGAGLFILFVASLTIIVAMTMATYQRRRQIGIMKVLGANLRQIRNMFIFESALLGVLGGLIGILLAHWVIWGINAAVILFSGQGAQSDVLFISYYVLPLGMAFAVMTGVLSGLYPAIKASRTDALTAIKRE